MMVLVLLLSAPHHKPTAHLRCSSLPGNPCLERWRSVSDAGRCMAMGRASSSGCKHACNMFVGPEIDMLPHVQLTRHLPHAAGVASVFTNAQGEPQICQHCTDSTGYVLANVNLRVQQNVVRLDAARHTPSLSAMCSGAQLMRTCI